MRFAKRKKPIDEDEKDTPVMETEDEEGELDQKQVQKIKQNVEYFRDNYMGVFAPEDFHGYSHICSLLFGILIELREIKRRL